MIVPHAIAVDHRNGDVLVADRENAKVHRYSEDGAHRDTWTACGRTYGIDVKGGYMYLGIRGRDGVGYGIRIAIDKLNDNDNIGCSDADVLDHGGSIHAVTATEGGGGEMIGAVAVDGAAEGSLAAYSLL